MNKPSITWRIEKWHDLRKEWREMPRFKNKGYLRREELMAEVEDYCVNKNIKIRIIEIKETEVFYNEGC